MCLHVFTWLMAYIFLYVFLKSHNVLYQLISLIAHVKSIRYPSRWWSDGCLDQLDLTRIGVLYIHHGKTYGIWWFHGIWWGWLPYCIYLLVVCYSLLLNSYNLPKLSEFSIVFPAITWWFSHQLCKGLPEGIPTASKLPIPSASRLDGWQTDRPALLDRQVIGTMCPSLLCWYGGFLEWNVYVFMNSL